MCYDQQNLKDILDAAIISTSEESTYDNPNVSMTPKPVNKPTTRKSLCLFTNVFNVKNKTAKLRVGAAKPKRRSMKIGNILWNKKNK